MITFSTYAKKKFDILNRHKVYFRQEQIEETVFSPDNVKKRSKYFFARKEGVEVVYILIDNTPRVITFFPIK
jgi:hypothetical protein